MCDGRYGNCFFAGGRAVIHARRLINQALGQVAVGETGIPEPVLGIQVKLGVHRVQSPGGIVGDAMNEVRSDELHFAPLAFCSRCVVAYVG